MIHRLPYGSTRLESSDEEEPENRECTVPADAAHVAVGNSCSGVLLGRTLNEIGAIDAITPRYFTVDYDGYLANVECSQELRD